MGLLVWTVLCAGIGLLAGTNATARPQWVELVGSIGFAMLVWCAGVVLWWLVEPLAGRIG